jgi:protein-tyrosine-phosphatase
MTSSVAPYKYDITAKSAMMWANSELEHVGRIVAVKDKHIQRSYAMSTLNGMAHLKDALFELVNDPAYKMHKTDLLKKHDEVIRVMKHLIKDFKLDLATIRAFNTDHVLSNMGYLNTKRKTRKNKK